MDFTVLAIIAMALIGIHYFLVKLIAPYVYATMVGLLSCVLVLPVMFAFIRCTETPIVPEQPIYLGYTFVITGLLAIGALTHSSKSLDMSLELEPLTLKIL